MMVVVSTVSCGKKESTSSVDIEEQGQQIGEAMASVDEAGGSGGSLGWIPAVKGEGRMFARLERASGSAPIFEGSLIPSAQAAACSGASTFGSCSSNTVTRSFGSCTVGMAVFTGNVTLSWGGSSTNCQMSAANDTVTRVPAFTVTGRRGATLTVSKTGSVGQRLTWSSGSGASRVFSMSNDGIRRVFTSAAGATLLDFTTQTTSAITVTGTSRANRVMSGGVLRVTNNISGVACDYVPSAVTWSSASCNCPISGSWSATCSDGSASSLSITGCGTANLTLGSDTTAVTFDRCGT